jgi:hemolysin activation/secretion protein
MRFKGAWRIVLASSAFGTLAIGGKAVAQDVPPTVEPGVIEQEFRALPDRYSDSAVSVPTASGPAAPAGAETQRFALSSLSVEGVTAFSDDEIRGLYADRLGTEISLADLFGIAQEITRLYSDSGYPLSVAFVPAQEIEGGAARIKVHEGYVAEVEITGDAGSSRPALDRLAGRLMGERPLSARTLERYLLLANDLPGVSVQAVIDRASAEPGAIKVIFAVERRQVNAALTINNRGSAAIGPIRVQTSAAMNGLMLSGDRLRGDIVQTTDGDELSFFALGYDVPLGDDGFRFGFVGSWSDSNPGTEVLEALSFNSDGWTAGFEGSYPVIRSRSRNLILGGSLDYKELESRFDSVINSRDVLWAGRANLAFDTMGSAGGVSSLFLQLSQGFDVGEATAKGDPDASRARGTAEFFSVLMDAGRVQPLGDGSVELALASRLQIAGQKLLASEECGYGGAAMGRAFDNFEISGDHCFLASAEIRRREPTVIVGDLLIAPYGFVDVGHVWTHGAAAPGQESAMDAQSLGGGFRFSLGESLSAYLEYAQPFSHDVTLEENRDARLFVGLTARR